MWGRTGDDEKSFLFPLSSVLTPAHFLSPLFPGQSPFCQHTRSKQKASVERRFVRSSQNLSYLTRRLKSWSLVSNNNGCKKVINDLTWASWSRSLSICSLLSFSSVSCFCSTVLTDLQAATNETQQRLHMTVKKPLIAETNRILCWASLSLKIASKVF